MLADCISGRTRTWRCVVVLLLAVAGIVTGLLAMHVVSTPMSQPHEFSESRSATAVSTNTSPVLAPTSGGNAMASGCAAGGCDPMHDMTVMVCTLALLGATLLLLAPSWGRGLLGIGSRAAPANLVGMIARSVGCPPPPSLLALSVDRR
ncbi:DUF6153 family protein [Leifsonia sp. AG29]|uniref:DUF6153 family protein n=1 Tax=Leifsonia sp. AG29 TaxID=2598860 RepID=UPI00131AC5F6|nr:DUF6153 family protein [Leifsonia sp. AG29]